MFAALVIFAVLASSHGDTPANCTYEETLGKWTLYVGAGGHDNTLDCTQFDVESNFTVDLRFPDLAVDERNNSGFWTIVYNQGYELVIGERTYFAFFDYNKANSNLCDKTKNGWAHAVNGTDWACYRASKATETHEGGKTKSHSPPNIDAILSRPYRVSQDFVDRINAAQSSWKATIYPEFANNTVGEMLARSGGLSRSAFKEPDPSFEPAPLDNDLPSAWDWRDVNGVDFVSPVRNQGGCGSCYAFASMGMLEARLRILTNNTVQDVFSPQDVISCSEYAQGCEGGFEYLIAGKYAEDFGVVKEECNRYLGHDTKKCGTKSSCARQHAHQYRYVGGYFGACNESAMLTELVKNGPIAVAFEVYGDFGHYRSGIYHHVVKERGVHLDSGFNPFQIVNHGVLIVGYGSDEQSGEKYWIVKNSWGATWGEKGFFRIRRGTNECSIENMAVVSTPIVQK